MTRLQMWGGVECTVNRVGDRYHDQLERSGHLRRPSDLERFAALGIKALRVPVLWERLAPSSLDDIDWKASDTVLARVRDLGMRPIVGLLHHGSGPCYTSLADPAFPAKLALFAGRVADRYPWVDAYTPLNEPLTTARFSGLYGVWYPHARDEQVFTRILLNECAAIRAAMGSIRAVNPSAELVQTEDLGHVYSTTFLAYQAAYENERRWLALDLLTGRVGAQHPFRKRLETYGACTDELDAFCGAPCAPDILGINHYITSNRFLDERVERYPKSAHGGNGRHRYADVEAVRVGAARLVNPYDVLREAWDRYHLPLAVTEAHLSCTRDEQMRWLLEVWNAALKLSGEGARVHAVTAWSLLGAFDWESLVTRESAHYESGVFDLRAPEPRPTALCGVVRSLARGLQPDHPVLDERGWWHRIERVLYPPVQCSRRGRRVSDAPRPRSRRELLITGARGTLGRAFAALCKTRGLAYRLLDRRALDIACPESVRRAIDTHRPWAVINAAGYCRVDDAEHEPDSCMRENAVGAARLADACGKEGIPLATFSSDLVFDGRTTQPYRESAEVAPICVYGRSKAQAEIDVRMAHPGALVIRTSAFFGPWDEYNFLTVALRSLARGSMITAAEDMTVSPTYVPDLVNVTLDLLIDGASGIWHLANDGATSWADFARAAAHTRGYDPALVHGVAAASLGLIAPRPIYSALASERGHGLMPPLEAAIERYSAECRVAV